MLSRILFSVANGWRCRHQLAEILANKRGNPLELELTKLKESGIKAIVFDFDGVLATHGEAAPNIQALQLLQQSIAIFGAEQVFILSNKPSSIRANYFKQHFPGIRFISAKRKKPYPDGLQEIATLTPWEKDTIALIDDRLLTGALATVLAGTQCIYVDQPLINYQKHPFTELFFQTLRILERQLLATIKKKD